MQKEDIRIRHVIVHILDSTVGLPVLSDQEIEFGSDFAEFLRDHIFRPGMTAGTVRFTRSSRKFTVCCRLTGKRTL